MKHKILFLISVLILSNVFGMAVSAQQSLEVLYPEIFGTAPGPETGLPDYITYIFKFSIAIIGLIIFAVLVYSGVNYLLSFGNPSKLSDAIKGMVAAGFGGLILLGAFIIFNTLNPQLKILTPPPLAEVAGLIPSGVYICNHEVSNIETILDKYISGSEQEKKEAVNEFIDAIYKGVKKYCRKANTGKVTISGIKTMFVVPERTGYDIATQKYSWQYTSAIIIKETNPTLGTSECFLFPSSSNNKIFRSGVWPYSGGDIDADDLLLYGGAELHPFEIFLVKKLDADPPESNQGVILYEGVARNTMGKLGVAETKDLASMSYKPEGNDEIRKITNFETDKEREGEKITLHKNTRSIEVEPAGKYIAILQRATTLRRMCDIIDNVENNLGNRPMGRCGTSCLLKGIPVLGKLFNRTYEEYCYSCFDEMTVIKGSIVR